MVESHPPIHISELTRQAQSFDHGPPAGQSEIVLAALAIGITLMGMQLWLLTVALDMFLGGKGDEVWQLAIVSGAIFAGGWLMTRLIQRRPDIRGLQRSP